MERGRMRCRCYISSIYNTFSRLVAFVALLCAVLSLHACIVICVLLLLLCRSNPVVHVIQLVL